MSILCIHISEKYFNILCILYCFFNQLYVLLVKMCQFIEHNIMIKMMLDLQNIMILPKQYLINTNKRETKLYDGWL